MPEKLPDALAGEAAPLAQLRAVLAFEVQRARGLLAAGRPLLGELRGRARIAVAAFIAGGEAALDAIERAGYDVRGGAPPATRVRGAAGLGGGLLRGGW